MASLANRRRLPKEVHRIGRLVSITDADTFIGVENEDEIIVTADVTEPVWAAENAKRGYARHPFTAYYIAVIGYSIYSYMNKPRMPNFGSNGNGGLEEGPTYSWDGIRTQQNVRGTGPVVYGEHRVGIVNQAQTERITTSMYFLR